MFDPLDILAGRVANQIFQFSGAIDSCTPYNCSTYYCLMDNNCYIYGCIYHTHTCGDFDCREGFGCRKTLGWFYCTDPNYSCSGIYSLC
jgi:hypothetical protein